MEFSDFRERCEARFCLRKTTYNEKTCIRLSKQRKCYDRWLRKQENSPDKEIFPFKTQAEVWKHYLGFFDGQVKRSDWKDHCMLFSKLPMKIQNFFLQINKDELWLCENLDVAHIKGKGSHPHLKDVIDNQVVLNRVSHSRLDQGKHPILKNLRITPEDRLAWFEFIKTGEKSNYISNEFRDMRK